MDEKEKLLEIQQHKKGRKEDDSFIIEEKDQKKKDDLIEEIKNKEYLDFEHDFVTMAAFS